MYLRLMFVSECKAVGLAGGVERVISRFANEFVNRGHEVSFVCMDQRRGSLFFPLAKRVRFVNLAYDFGCQNFGGWAYFRRKISREIIRAVAGKKMTLMGHRFRDPKQEYFQREFVSRLRECLKTNPPDIILTLHADGPALTQQALGERNIPIIAMCHADPAASGDFDLPERVEAWRKCAAAQVVLPVFRPFMENLGFRNILVIPNPVSQTADEQVTDLENCQHKIITIGRLEGAGKRQHLLLEAFALIANKCPEWQVEIYGSIGSQGYVKRIKKLIAELNLSERVRYCGPTKDVPRVLHSADIFVFPSRHEAFGLALAEAMSAGLAVIAYKECMAANELIKDKETGLLSNAGAESLADTMEELIRNKELRCRLGKSAHASMKKYAAAEIWDRWENELGRLVNKKAAQRAAGDL